MTLSIEEMATFCKKKGFVYPSSEIYGGFAGFFDYGPLGVELKNNLKTSWWNCFVKSQDNIVGIDGSIVSPQKVWEASGHLESFADVLIECQKCHSRHRADLLIEEQFKLNVEGKSVKEINQIVKKKGVICPECKSKKFGEGSAFNLMFETRIGAKDDGKNVAYLRGETAQIIFTNFKNVIDTNRLKLPFGIAQTGKAFRNEISPREFLFRVREFELMELEFFTHPQKVNACPLINRYLNKQLNVFSAKDQKGKKKHRKIKVKDLLKLKINKWHAYWLVKQCLWFVDELGVNPNNLRIREHLPEELSHYAQSCFDIEYNFPMGWREAHGNADRGQFDLTQHQKHSGKKLEYFDEETKQKVVPHVAAEPSQGVGRAFLVALFEAYHDDKKRGNIVLKLPPQIAPYFCAVFPLVKNKPPLVKKARKIYEELKECFACFYDEVGSVGRRYSRQDEIGTPICLTLDFQSLEDDTITLRDRDTTHQIRVSISQLKNALFKFNLGKKLEGLGQVIK